MLIKRKEAIIDVIDSIYSGNISHSITIEEFGFKNEILFDYVILSEYNKAALFKYHDLFGRGRCIYVGGIFV